eukprot:12339024-Ditylum_brightwellii.AAC.1
MGATVQQLIATMAGPTHSAVMDVAHAEIAINIIQAGTTMITAGTISQQGIETMITKAVAMPASLVTLTSMSIIMTKEVEEATVVMIGKKEIAIMLVTKASHIMWMRSTVVLAPKPRGVAALPATAAFQASAVLVLALCQGTSRGVTITTIQRTPTWT